MCRFFFTPHLFLIVAISLLVSSASRSQTTSAPGKDGSQPTGSGSIQTGTSINWIPAPLKRIDIPFRLHYYEHIKSQVIASKIDLEDMLKGIPQPPERHRNQRYRPWRDLQAFRRAMREYQVDFSRNAIVLIQHTVGSGTPTVSLAQPLIDLDNRTLLLEVRRFEHGYGTFDMANYCFAIVVPRNFLDEVIITTTGNASLTINKSSIQSTRKKIAEDLVLQIPKNAVEQRNAAEPQRP